MKREKIIFLWVAITTFLVGCNSILDEVPITSQNPDAMYSNDATVLSGLNGVYVSLRSQYGGNFTFATEVYAGLGSQTTGMTFVPYQWDSKLTASEPLLSQFWNAFYSGIARSNTFIDRVNVMTAPIDTTLKKRVIAEAKFIRAFHYFHLVRCWGEVPLHVNRPIDFNNSASPVSSLSEIYSQIVSDLKYAELNCWNKTEVKGKYQNENGRITKLAATALLARVYLEMASSSRYSYSDRNANYRVFANTDSIYRLCKERCDAAIASKDFGLQPNWSDIWSPTNKDNIEYILTAQYAPSAGQGSSFFTQYVPSQCTFNRPNSDGIKAINSDLMKQYSFAPWNYSSAQDPRYVMGILRTMIDRYTGDTITLDEAGASYKIKKSGAAWSANLAQAYFVRTSRWMDPSVQILGMSAMDYGLIRSAELYLMRSEALVEISGNPVDGLDDINKVRSRCGAPLLTATTVSDFNTKVVVKYSGAMNAAMLNRPNSNLLPFHELLLNERLIEFTLEGHRWYDLKRLGLLGAVTLREFSSNPTRQRNDYYEYYWPYPQDEINFNPNIVQKSGY